MAEESGQQTGSSLSGGGGLVGGIISSIGNIVQAGRNRRFQRQHAKNKYQWAVQDLRLAGLNPILAAGGGISGGGSPSGAMGQISDLGDNITTAKKVESERKLRDETGKMQSQQTKLSQQQVRLIDAQILKEHSITGVNSAQAQNTTADTLLKINQKDRWQPISDVGGALSTLGTSPLRERLGNIPSIVKSMGASNAEEMRKIYDQKPRELMQWLRERQLYNDKWEDNWKTQNRSKR